MADLRLAQRGEHLAAFRKAGARASYHQYVGFDQSRGPQFNDHEVDLDYDETADTGRALWRTRDAVKTYLYDLNPPQRPRWP
jgi:hypothetical protein